MFTQFMRKGDQIFWGSRYDHRESMACVSWNRDRDLISLFVQEPDKYFPVAPLEEQIAYLLRRGPQASLSRELKNALAKKARQTVFTTNLSYSLAAELDPLETVHVDSFDGVFANSHFPIYRARHEARILSMIYYTARYASLSMEERKMLLKRVHNLKSF